MEKRGQLSRCEMAGGDRGFNVVAWHGGGGWRWVGAAENFQWKAVLVIGLRFGKIKIIFLWYWLVAESATCCGGGEAVRHCHIGRLVETCVVRVITAIL